MAKRNAVEQDPRWQSVKDRDPKADGTFYYSVRSTGVYCHPSCASRRAKPENVAFHATRESAEKAGFRPCKRCKPDQPSSRIRQSQLATKLCRFIENSEQRPTLQALADHIGLSRFHTQRLFKSMIGVSPKEYADASLATKVRKQLHPQHSVTTAMYQAGYESPTPFYRKAKKILGMSPNHFRKGGINCEIRFAIGECSLGSILVAASEQGICAISLGDDPLELAHELEERFPAAQLIGNDREFEQRVAQVVGLIETPKASKKRSDERDSSELPLDIPLDIRGTVFQQQVWKALTKIPVGQTSTYAEIARTIGKPSAARAVAQACAANPIAVAIPCHRVIRSDGDLSGYRWGIERKRKLLEREQS